MSSFGKELILKGKYEDIEEGMNSGTFEKLNKKKMIKSFLSVLPQFFLIKL